MSVVGLFASLVMAGGVSMKVSATSPSWVSARPTVFSSDAIPDSGINTHMCAGSTELLQVAGDMTLRNVCLSNSHGVRIGSYFNSNHYEWVIGFNFDTMMYRLYAGCDIRNSCVYLPESDTLVTRQFRTSSMVRSLVIYRNFTHKLSKQPAPLSLMPDYVLRNSRTDYIFQNADGHDWAIGGVGVSENEKWLAVELRERGVGLLNLQTMEMKRISMLSFGYGVGSDPMSELAVSNDGKHVAVMGMNAGLSVFEISDSCGEVVTDERMSVVKPLAHTCPVSSIDTNEFMARFSNGLRPKFDMEGGELSFYALSYLGEARRVALRAAGYGGQKLDYLALGDSFNSGEGETSDDYYLSGTNNLYEKCHVSSRSYPFLLGKALRIDSALMKSVACSGAVTGDVVGVNGNYWGQGGRLSLAGLDMTAADKTGAQSAAIDMFTPGRVKQLTFVKRYQPKVITIGIGGNDAGFMQKLRACLGPDTCSWAATVVGKEQTALEVRRLFGTLVATYQEIRDASPTSKIYAVGYPKVIDERGSCDILTGYLLNDDEKRFMNEGITYINQVVAAAAQRVGAMYVDVEASFGDQTLCGSVKPSAMNGIRVGDDGPVTDKLNWLKIIGQESFHPTPEGHRLIAASILRDIPDLLSDTDCSRSQFACRLAEMVAPTPPSYWVLDARSDDLPSQQAVSYVTQRRGAESGGQKTLALIERSLQPDSLVRVEINSEPVVLGEFHADNNGGFSAQVDLPDDLEEGYHTVHLYGTSYSGEAVDLYDVIRYEKVISNQPSRGEMSGDVGSDTTADSSLASGVSKESIVSASGLASVLVQQSTLRGDLISDTVARGADEGRSGGIVPGDFNTGVLGRAIQISKGGVIAEADQRRSMWVVYVGIGLVSVGVVVGVMRRRKQR